MSKLTLDDLANGKSNNKLRKIDTNILGAELEAANPKEKEEIKTPEIVSDAFNALENTINKKMKMAEEMVKKAEEAAEEYELEKEVGTDEEALESEKNVQNTLSNLDYLDDELDKDLEEDINYDEDKDLGEDDYDDIDLQVKREKKKVNIKVEKIEKHKSDIEIEEDDDEDNATDELDALLADIDNENSNDIEDEEDLAELRAKYKKQMGKVIISKDPINFSEYEIAEETVSAASILNSVRSNPKKKKADWPLYHSGINITVEECEGQELDALRKTIRSSNDINGVIASIRFIYNHIVDANKPSFETWCKRIRTEDFESLYFAQHLACYNDSNLISRTDNSEGGCGKSFLEETDPYTMVNYADDDVKEECERIRNQDSTSEDHKVKSKLLQISDQFAISYKPATLYNTFIQYATLRSNITEKYQDILDTLAYIENFYYIDKESKKLKKLKIKTYPNNINKTVLNKLKVYTKILKTLNNDQYNIVTGKLANLAQEPKVTYVYPKTKCKECGHEIDEEPVQSTLNLLFTRAQLAQIKNF